LVKRHHSELWYHDRCNPGSFGSESQPTEVCHGEPYPAGDEDADGLSNGDEQTHGTDPYACDTDGDGYSDADEVHATTDPLDSTSVIYQGGWPYNRNKNSIVAPSWKDVFVQGMTASSRDE